MQYKSALVTGGATRVGRVFTEYLASILDRIVIIYNSSQDEAYELTNTYKNIDAIQCDLLDRDALHKTIQTIQDMYSIHILVNNASIMPEASIETSTVDMISKTFTLHVDVPWTLTQQFSHTLMHVINVLDIKIESNQSKRAAYLLSKKTLAEFTKMAALEYAPSIQINGIAIGWIFEPNGKKRHKNIQQAYMNKIPLKKKVEERDLIDALTYLLRSSQATGQIINLAGGKELV